MSEVNRQENVGELSLSILGDKYTLSGAGVEQLRNSIIEAQAGKIVSVRLSYDARPATAVKKPVFRFLTKRGAERVNKKELQQLLSLCARVLDGEKMYWPPTFTTTYIGSN